MSDENRQKITGAGDLLSPQPHRPAKPCRSERRQQQSDEKAGYQAGHGPSGSGNRHTFGGLTDAAFRMVPLLEASRNARWPWEN